MNERPKGLLPETGMTEEWRPILAAKYEVSDLGRVRRATRGRGTAEIGRVLKPHHANTGYLTVNPVVDGRNRKFTIHELVALAFIGPRPPGACINHIDGNKTNPARLNLEYVTHAQNMAHAAATGLIASGERSGHARLTGVQVAEIRRLRAMGMPLKQIAERFGIGRTTAGQIVNRKRWAHV